MSRRAIIIVRHPSGPRVFVAGQRVHHGVTGILALSALLSRRRYRLAAAAALIVLHDLHDWRIWFVREVPATTLTTPELSGRM